MAGLSCEGVKGELPHSAECRIHDVSFLRKQESSLLCACFGVHAGQAGTRRDFLDSRFCGNDSPQRASASPQRVSGGPGEMRLASFG